MASELICRIGRNPAVGSSIRSPGSSSSRSACWRGPLGRRSRRAARRRPGPVPRRDRRRRPDRHRRSSASCPVCATTPTPLLDVGKQNLGAARLVNFLALAYLLATTPLLGALARTPAGEAAQSLGRHSLPVFAVGSLLCALGQAGEGMLAGAVDVRMARAIEFGYTLASIGALIVLGELVGMSNFASRRRACRCALVFAASAAICFGPIDARAGASATCPATAPTRFRRERRRRAAGRARPRPPAAHPGDRLVLDPGRRRLAAPTPPTRPSSKRGFRTTGASRPTSSTPASAAKPATRRSSASSRRWPAIRLTSSSGRSAPTTPSAASTSTRSAPISPPASQRRRPEPRADRARRSAVLLRHQESRALPAVRDDHRRRRRD